jgi:hypothetical protein
MRCIYNRHRLTVRGDFESRCPALSGVSFCGVVGSRFIGMHTGLPRLSCGALFLQQASVNGARRPRVSLPSAFGRLLSLLFRPSFPPVPTRLCLFTTEHAQARCIYNRRRLTVRGDFESRCPAPSGVSFCGVVGSRFIGLHTG